MYNRIFLLTDLKRSLEGLISLKDQKLEASLARNIDGKTDKLISGIIHLNKEKLFKVDYEIQAEQIKDVVVSILF